LAALIAARRGLPFVWGRSDCACLAALAFEAMTGDSRPRALIVDRYATRREAVSHLRKLGARSLTEALDEVFALARSTRARAGDLVLVGGRLGPLGVVHGAGRAWVQGDAGLVLAPFPVLALAWEI
jgi:hypothetical protein